MSEPTENTWVSQGIVPRLASNGWSIRRQNKTSGKSRGGVIAKDMGEYQAKTLANDSNKGSSCFHCNVISPAGEIFRLLVVKG